MTEEEIINFRASTAVKEQLELVSKETGKSVSDLCREAILAYIGMYFKAKAESEADHDKK
jgi:predicted DNA-binding protein